MALPSNFNPATYLYLNPELEAFSNVMTIEAAKAFYTSSDGSNLMYDLSGLDPLFDASVYVHSSKDGLDISHMNDIIKTANIAQGFSLDELKTRSRFLQSIQQPLTYMGNNVFAFTDPMYTITPYNMIAGEDVKLVVQNEQDVIAKVVSMDTTVTPNQFQVSNYINFQFNASNTASNTATLFGQRLFDIERLAKVNWVRGFRSQDPYATYKLDAQFNPDLYRLLYPDARVLDNIQSLFDFTTHRNDVPPRIGRVESITRNVDDAFVTVATNKLEWASNATAVAVSKALWSSNYTGSYVSTANADIWYAPSNATNTRINWTSNALSNYFKSDGSKITVSDISALSNASVATTGTWTYAGNVNMKQYLTVGENTSNAATVLDVRGGIRAEDYVLSSDARTKTKPTLIDTNACLRIIKSMKPVSFAYKSKPHTTKLGFIAQDIQDIHSTKDIPIVGEIEDFVPDIMKHVALEEDGSICLPGHGLVCGDCIKVDGDRTVRVTAVLDGDRFVVDGASRSSCFLYGKLVKDFKVVDQSHLLTVAIGAIQRLSQRVHALELELGLPL